VAPAERPKFLARNIPLLDLFAVDAAEKIFSWQDHPASTLSGDGGLFSCCRAGSGVEA